MCQIRQVGPSVRPSDGLWLKSNKNEPWGRRADGRTNPSNSTHITCYMVKLWGRRTDGRTNIGVFWLKSWTFVGHFRCGLFFLGHRDSWTFRHWTKKVRHFRRHPIIYPPGGKEMYVIVMNSKVGHQVMYL